MTERIRVRDHFDYASAGRRIELAEYAMSGRMPEIMLHPGATEAEAFAACSKVRRDDLFDASLCPHGKWTPGQYKRSVAERLPIWC